jgi:uncharacterized protein YcbX
MQGEEVAAVEVTNQGFTGDRAYALVDAVDGTVISAKNPRKWPNLLAFRARLFGNSQDGYSVRITLPANGEIDNTQSDINEILSVALGRRVILQNKPPRQPVLQQFHPDLNSVGGPERITNEHMLASTFFDLSVLHLLTTSTLQRLEDVYPQGRFSVQRFRPNLVLATGSESEGVVENNWIGRILRIGTAARLRVFQACARCVMTALPQEEAPKDMGILRTVVLHNGGNVGVHAAVLNGGQLQHGDQCYLE